MSLALTYAPIEWLPLTSARAEETELGKDRLLNVLEGAAGNLRSTIRNWRGRPDTKRSIKAVETLTAQFEETIGNIRESLDSTIRPETADAIWQLMEAIDAAAELHENEEFANHVGVATNSVRAFYLSNGATITSNNNIVFSR